MRRGLALLVLIACGRSEPYRLPLPRLDAGADAGVDAGCPADGCSDGTREGFLDACVSTAIAGCSGAFDVPGVLGATARCERRAGNDGANPTGKGCSVEDLCASGWHLCRGPDDVRRSSPDGCAPVAFLAAFFVTAQSGPGCGVCATGSNPGCGGGVCKAGCLQTAATSNDVFGCGGVGDPPDPTCAPLNKFGNNLCDAIGSPWRCGSDDTGEAHALVKDSVVVGGALCCRD